MTATANLTRRRVAAIAAATASFVAGTFAVRREILTDAGHGPDSDAVARLVGQFNDRLALERVVLAEIAADAGLHPDDADTLVRAFDDQVARIMGGATSAPSLVEVADGPSAARH